MKKMLTQRFAIITSERGATRRGFSLYFSAASRPAFALSLFLVIFCAASFAQEQQPRQTPTPTSAPSQTDDVIRVESNLIQAGVTVLDKQGRFVEGLKAEQFDVRVDGKPQKISFFDQVAAGSAEERAKLSAAARGGARSSEKAAETKAATPLPGRGRVVLFFLDDFHKSASSIQRARKAIEHFADKEMGADDMAAVATASGQLGFLQQLTASRSVLKIAASRLRPREVKATDGQQPLMTEYIAKAILVEGDRELLETYVQPLLRDRTMRRPAAEAYVMERARSIHQLATEVTRNTLRGLQSMVRAVSPLAGRKLVFFLSDGFLLSYTDNETGDMVRNITDAAVRSGFVIYTIDSRGLATDSWVDAENPLPVDDMTGSVLRATRGEMSASQEALNQLAGETGGRALLNTNDTNRGLSVMVNETAAYYVLAWQVPEGEQKGGKYHHLEVSIKDRPDLVVLVQRGFLEKGANTIAASARGKEKDAKQDELNTALAAAVPLRALPASLSLSYLSEQKDSAVLTALLSVPIASLARNNAGEVALEVRGYVVNLDGKIGSRFGERLTARATVSQNSREEVMYRHQVKLTPGVYQVRAAVMDLGGNRVGSVAEWIEIPDLKSNQLTLGSLVIGEKPKEAGATLNVENFVSQRGPDYAFARASDLRFMTYVYNAARGAEASARPDLEMQIQVSRDGKAVFTDEWRRVDATGQDFDRIAYGGEIALDTLTPGRYTLKLTVRDKISRAETTQSTFFFVE